MKKTLRKRILLGLTIACATLFCVACAKNDTKTDEGNVVYYTVTFDLCTDLKTNAALPKQVQKGKRLDAPQIYVVGDNPDNYFISDWYTDQGYSEESKWDFYFDSVQSDITLYAKWDAHIQYKVNFYNGTEENATYTATVDQGLTTARCDEQFNGYEVLGYYTTSAFDTEFNFDTPINENTNIYVKLSDYISLSPSYLSTFSVANSATVSLADDGGSVSVYYPTEAAFIYKKGMNFALNGYEMIELVCKFDVEGARADIFWFATDSSGNAVFGKTDYNADLQQVGLESFGTTVTTDEDGYTHFLYDLTEPRGYTKRGTIDAPLTDIAVLNGFRIDVYQKSPATITIKSVKGVKKPEPTGYSVNYYVGGRLSKSVEVDKGEKATKPADSEIVSGRQVVGYYTDADFTTAFDFENTAITATTNLYVKVSDYMYFDGAMLNGFSGHDMDKSLGADGTMTMTRVGSDSYIYNNGLNLSLNGGNCIEIKAKLNLSGRLDLYIFGDYTLDGTAGSSTNFGQNYTRYRGMTTQGWSVSAADSEGYVTMRFNLAYTANGEGAKDFAYTTIKGFRMDIMGGNLNDSITIEYVKSVEVEQVYNIQYYNGSTKLYTDTATRGTKATKPSDSTLTTGRQVLGFFTDSAMTQAFDFNTEITKDITIYVQISDYMYLYGTTLNGFTASSGTTKTLNEDGTITLGGKDGYIHKKGLNLSLNGGNCIEIKAKLSLNGGRMDLYVFGDYTLDGTAGSNTDYGQPYTRFRGITTQGWSVSAADSEGYVTMQFNLAYTVNGEGAKDFAYTTIKGFRIDLVGGNESNTAQIAYVKSVTVNAASSAAKSANFVETDEETANVAMSKQTLFIASKTSEDYTD